MSLLRCSRCILAINEEAKEEETKESDESNYFRALQNILSYLCCSDITLQLQEAENRAEINV